MTPLEMAIANQRTTEICMEINKEMEQEELEKSQTYDMVNPDHYKNSSIETIEKMRRIWGNDTTAIHCEMCAFKYRERLGSKPGNSVEQELSKIRWYEAKAKELTQPIGKNQ